MKVAIIGPYFPDSFAKNVCVSLQRMGCDVLPISGRRAQHDKSRYVSAFWRFLPKLLPAVDERMHREIYSQIADYKPHAVLVTYDFFAPAVVERIKAAAKAPVLCWFIDPIANLHGGKLFLCRYDAFFCKEPRLVEVMHQKLGLPAFYLPEACNPQWHRPVTPTAEQRAQYGCDVVAQGTFHPYRAKFFEALTDFDVKIWGSPAPNHIQSSSRKLFQNHYIAEDEKAVAFNSAKVLLNAMNFAEVRGVNNTLFEGAGCGAFQICDAQPTLPEFFKPDEEVITFSNRSELLEKLRYYLAHDEERKTIGQRASARAHREHTYEHRLAEMFRISKLN